MRLIDTETLFLREFVENIPPYAILSHTWGSQEVTLQDWDGIEKSSKKEGIAKIRGACNKALDHGFKWLWADTICIDKTSSAELTEAINSMFVWYTRSEECYTYLSDVVFEGEADDDSLAHQLARSRWFTRGWTLQELLAPERVTFYDRDWTRLGSRNGSLAGLVSEITGIGLQYLRDRERVQDAPIARKMSWLARRKTTRVEDIAYCMLGLFDINMPPLYGEGTKAFTRLQHEIILSSNDHTIFCWSWTDAVPSGWTSLLAPSPSQFLGVDVEEDKSPVQEREGISIYSMTNAGLSIRLPVVYALSSYFVLLRAGRRIRDKEGILAIQVYGRRKGNALHVARLPFPEQPVIFDASINDHLGYESLLVKNSPSRRILGRPNFGTEFSLRRDQVLLLFDSPELLDQLHVHHGDHTGAKGPQDFSPLLGTIELTTAIVQSWNPKNPPTYAQVAIIHMTMSGQDVFVFVATWVRSPDIMSAYCQVFDGRPYVSRENYWLPHRQRVLEDLSQQVAAMKPNWQQPAYYDEYLDVSIIVDTTSTTLKGNLGVPFVRLSKGRRDFTDFVSRGKESEYVEFEDHNDDSVHTTVWKTFMIPNVGRFVLPNIEDYGI